MQPLIDGGAGTLTFAEAEGMGLITAAQRAQLEGGLTAIGVDPSTVNIAEAQGAYTTAAQTASVTAGLLADQEVDAEKTASGFTPIISVNISPSEKWNIALKYEHNTKLEFTNKTTSDVTTGYDEEGNPITMFPDGAKSRLDIPSQIVAGLTYRPIDPLLISTGFHYYLDKNADWDGREELLDHNSWEFGLGLEYGITEKLKASAGYLRTQSGATEAYQTDLSFSLPSNSVGGGLAYQILPIMELNLGGSYTVYQKGEKNFDYDAAYGLTVPVTETYEKPIWIVAIGLNFNFGATK
jgi:long-subunit fatty acid transport protein